MTPAAPHVALLHISPARGIPMRSVDTASMQAGSGITGDRYANSRHRHVSVQALDQLEAAARTLGSEIDPGLTRRNITVRGIEIPHTPGNRIMVGEVELEVVRVAAPCRLLDDQIGDGARVALRRRAGSICRVLTGGVIAVGDAVTVLD